MTSEEETHLSGLSLLEVFSLLESSSYLIIAFSSHIEYPDTEGISSDEWSEEVDCGESRLCSCFTIALQVSITRLSQGSTLLRGFSFPTIMWTDFSHSSEEYFLRICAVRAIFFVHFLCLLKYKRKKNLMSGWLNDFVFEASNWRLSCVIGLAL